MRRLGWALAAALMGGATQGAAQGWEHVYYPAEPGVDIAVCTAGIYYADGPFVVRVYDRVVDFYLADDELALPPGRVLGDVVFLFHDIDFVLSADTGPEARGGPVDHLYLTPRAADVPAILERLRGDRDMEIAFPDGLAYTIDLEGSSAALAEAFACWSRETTGVAAAPPGRNPFAASEPQGRDPFR